jgi:hypothetical protein
MTNAYNILVGKTEGQRSLGRPKRRWEDNFRIDLRIIGLKDLRKIGLEGVNRMRMAQDMDQ